MDAVEFLKEWKRFRKEEHRTNCIICKNRDRSIEKRGMCVCNSEENLVDCMIRNIDIVENWSKTHPVIELTEQQKTAIRGRIAEGTPWLAKHSYCEGIVVFYSQNPKEKTDFLAASSNSDIYNFVTIENSPLYLPVLLGGEE